MREYELFYLVGESKEAELPAVRTAVEKIVMAEGGSFLPPETFDKRKLAYPVQGETRGTYIARRFTMPDASELAGEELEKTLQEKTSPIDRVQRQLALEKTVLRSLIVRADELPELKKIERTEYAKREVRAQLGRRDRGGTPVPSAVPTVPMATPTEAEKQVSKEEIDAQLKAKLDI